MKLTGPILTSIITTLTITTSGAVSANDVKILSADFRNSGDQRWSVSVTLEHSDTGWKHYADGWRIIDGDRNILGNRVLYHPHVSEQPFNRNLSGVKIPTDITTVYIEAHDKVHGWTSKLLEIDLNKAKNGRLYIKAKQ